MKKKDLKAKNHARRMEEKRLDKVERETTRKICQLVLLFSYAALAEEFKFDYVKLSKYRKRMNRYSVYVAEGNITEAEIMQILDAKGIDVTKIGDEDE